MCTKMVVTSKTQVQDAQTSKQLLPIQARLLELSTTDKGKVCIHANHGSSGQSLTQFL